MVLDLTCASRADIEQEIAETTSYLRKLRLHLNFHIPVSRLLPEILLEIFSIIVNEWRRKLYLHSTSPRRHRPTVSYTWLGITQVCHYWRELAVQSPKLWYTIVLNKEQYIGTMLRRSRQMSLSLHYYTVKPDEERQFRLYNILRPELIRITSMRFQVVYEDRGERISFGSSLFKCSLPSIQAISLLLSTPYPGMSSPQIGKEPFECWMAKDDNHLRSLTLVRTSFLAAETAIRSSLRHLCICKTYRMVTMPKLLHLLERVPLLETLSLDKSLPCVPYSVSELPKPRKVVTLPKLRSLHVSSFGLSPGNFLRHLSYPITTSVKVESECGYAQPDISPTALVASLSSTLPFETGDISLRSISVCINDDEQTLCGWVENMGDWAMHPSDDTAICIIRIEEILKAEVTIFGALVSTMMSRSVETLYLEMPPNCYWDVYEAIITASNVRSLYISSTSNLFHLLSQESENTPFPQLAHLWIGGSVLGGHVVGLNKILAERMAGGNMIETLSIPQCDAASEVNGELVGFLDLRGGIQTTILCSQSNSSPTLTADDSDDDYDYGDDLEAVWTS